MRIMVVSAPLAGHLLPLVPLAAALREAGHDVRLAGGGVPAVGTDLAVHDLVPGIEMSRIAARILPVHPITAWREMRGRAGTRGVGLLFGAVNAALLDPLDELVASWRPDLVVHEPLAIAGAVAAARHGVPAVLQDNTLFDGQELIAATAASPHLRRAARRHGVRRLPPPASRLNNLPPSLATGRPGQPLRPVPWSGTGEVPEWLRRPPARPRLIVTHSTIAGAGGAAHLQPVLAAAAGLDAEVVLVRPPSNLTVPPAVRTTGWVPLAAVLPHATAVAHHGGAGTTLGALAAGIPQLAVPGSGDRRHNSAVVSGSGAGLAVPARGITRDVLHRLLHDRHLRANACELRDEIAAMPGPAEVSRTITALLSRGGA